MTAPVSPLQRASRFLILLAPLGLLLCAPATSAPGFDCTQARTAVEKLICSDAGLSGLDAKLNAAYETASEAASADQKQKLTAEQRQWLSGERNKCTDTACLSRSYNSRLNALDPFADDKLTCKEMREHPERIFGSDSIDLGSGFGSPLDVDYDCPESLQQQGFMAEILALAERIHGDYEPQQCSGSIVYATGRYYDFSLTEAGFDPQGLLSRSAGSGRGTDWKTFATRDETSDDSAVPRYFRDWSESSPVNFDLYRRFAAAFDRAFPQLVKLYRARGLSQSDAQAAARIALSRVLDRAAGSFPRDLLGPVPPLVARIRDGSFRPEEVNGQDFHYGNREIYAALTVALLRGAPPTAVEALAGKLDLSNPAAFGKHLEPLLAFATGDTRNLEILLRRKSPVDTANDFGKTALFYAIGFSQHEAVRLLLGHGADANHAYKSARELRPDADSIDDECFYPALQHTRRTPLMHAAQNSDLAMVKLLLDAHADRAATDDLGFNALDYAALGQHADIVAYLESLGMVYGASKPRTAKADGLP